MFRIKRECTPATETGGRPARGEENFVCSFSYIIIVKEFDIVKRPYETVIVVVVVIFVANIESASEETVVEIF